MTELGVLYSELDHVIRNLKEWMRTESENAHHP